MKTTITASLFATKVLTASTAGYSDLQAQISLDLSINAYCGKESYKTLVFSGPSEGFVYTKTLSNILSDVEGYVGYLPSDSSIFVVFRGTDSLRNLVMDADATSSAYDVSPECGDCKVHTGFYNAVNSVWNGLHKEVTRLQALYPNFEVKVTGHSMGAAMAQLTGLRLNTSGIKSYMINFGQPRVGNEAYANFANENFTE